MAMPSYNTSNLRAMLIGAGIGQYAAEMSLPYMNMLPSTCDPYAQGVMQLVRGLQRLLIRAGARLEVDGGLGARTAAAIARVSGPRWQDKSWSQLYGDAMSRAAWIGFHRTDRVLVDDPMAPEAMGDDAADLLARRDALIAQRGDGWCTVAHPQPGCTPVAGVAKPMNATVLASFQNIQRQLNRFLAHVLRQTSLTIDGRIGAGTVQALAAIKGKLAALKVALPQQTVDQIAAGHDVVERTLQAFADGLKLPAQTVTVAITTTSPPSVAAADGSVINPSDAAIAAANAAQSGLSLSSPLVIAAAVVGGALLVQSMRGGRGRRRRR